MKNGDEEILDIQKSYSEEIIQKIQYAIDSNLATIKVLTHVAELPKIIYLDGVKLSLTSLNNRYDTCMHFSTSIDNAFMKKWRTEPIYTFLYKDWKRLNKNINIFDNDNYIELTFNVGDVNIIALLRRVDIELADNSFALMEYGDICYNNAQYAIIKSFSPSIEERYDTSSELENKNISDKMLDNNGCEIEFGSDRKINMSIDDNTPIDDLMDSVSEELF